MPQLPTGPVDAQAWLRNECPPHVEWYAHVVAAEVNARLWRVSMLPRVPLRPLCAAHGSVSSKDRSIDNPITNCSHPVGGPPRSEIMSEIDTVHMPHQYGAGANLRDTLRAASPP